MSEETCVFHPGQKAVADCAKCGKSFCSVCLVNSEGRTLCRGCAEAPKPPAASLDDLDRLLKKTGSSDDDPLGLFGPKTAVGSPAAPPPAPAPVPAPPRPVPEVPQVPDAPRTPAASAPAIPSAPAAPASFPAPSPQETVPLRAVPGFGYEQPRRDASPLVVTWWRIEKSLKPLAASLRLPVPALAGLAFVLAAVLVLAPFLLLTGKEPVKTLPQVQPVHIVKVQVSQVGEMDINTYLELETKLQGMGFLPLMQMTVPQAPSPNFIAVFIKEGAGVYAEVMKLPGNPSPSLSFLTVFNNGVWCSTNGFAGRDQQAEYLLSTHHPSESPDPLYVKHMQKVEQLKQRNGWMPARMGESRFVAAFTDHLRWYLDWKRVPGYKASFGDWH